jgi:hypothetical protein
VLYRKPAYYAVQNLMSILDGAAAPMKHVAFQAADAPDLQVAAFTKAGHPLVFVWNAPPGIPSDDLAWTPTDLTLKSITFENPVYVELMSGNVYELRADHYRRSGSDTVLSNLPMRDSPVLITERQAVMLTR